MAETLPLIPMGQCTSDREEHEMNSDNCYRIEAKNGKLFCKCRLDQNGDPILIGTNTEISLNDLVKQAYSSVTSGRSGKKHKKPDSSC